jgi:hypothetical protein
LRQHASTRASASVTTHRSGIQRELKRGVGPESSNIDEYKRLAAEALDEIKEAANAEGGLYDLPLRGDTNQSGITRGAARAYTETSPYVQLDVQAELGHGEDTSRYGSSR